MSIKTMTLLFAFILSIISQLTYSQEKHEREERIERSDFPEAALTVINSLPKHCKRMRFYKETDGDKYSFETKFKYHKKNYSLEFSVEGQIEDLEVITQFKKIEELKKMKIQDYYEENYSKYNIVKIQEQYVYTLKYDAINFVNDILSNTSTVAFNFEIIAEVTSEKNTNLKEFTFDSTGLYLNSRTLQPSSYDHVLH